VAGHRRRVRLMRQAQKLVGPLPNRVIQATAALLALPGVEPRMMARYASWSDSGARDFERADERDEPGGGIVRPRPGE
jgi:hypothetical protein